MSTGTGKSFGNPDKRVSRTIGPPVEVPIAISRMSAVVRMISSFETEATRGTDRGQRLTTLTSDISFTVCTNSLAVVSCPG